MKTVENVEIFATGTHNGDPYTKDDLDTLVSSFNALKDELKVPVKIGHTSDEFNKELAKKIGVPAEIIDGEEGAGSIALGWLDNVRRKGNKLVADLKAVPEKVAEWIESGLYRAVSCEIWQGYKSGDKTYPYALCGLALLGAELPAVRNIEGLDSARIYKAQAPDKVVEWGVPESGLRDFLVDVVKRAMSALIAPEHPISPVLEAEKIENEQTEDELKELKAISLALGLGEDGKLDQILEAIKAIKGGEKQEKAEEAKPDEKAQEFADQVAKFQSEIATLKDENASVRADLAAKVRDTKVMFYTDIAKGWTCLSGKPEEFGAKLAAAEEIGRDVCETLLVTYDQANQTAKAARLTEPIGVPDAPEKKHAFLEFVDQLMKDRNLDYYTAFNAASHENESLFFDFQKNKA